VFLYDGRSGLALSGRGASQGVGIDFARQTTVMTTVLTPDRFFSAAHWYLGSANVVRP
jgi:hypothetical protein